MKPPKKFHCQIDLSNVALPEWKAQRMYLQGYRFVGKHSAIKLCEWTKKAIRNKNFCYKQKFYGIQSHRCIQMTPVAFFCDFNCIHCWRSLNFNIPPENFRWDSPELVFNGCISEFKKLIAGFKGNSKIRRETYLESDSPRHFAISLSGEPTLYPYLPEFIDLIKSNGKTAFLVTNGAHPDMIKKLIKHQPNFLYITLPAPDEEIFRKECNPIINDGWEKLNESLSLLKEFSCNTVIRLTLSKSSNMFYPEKYAKIIENAKPSFVEVKSYMAVGGARAKMPYESMPRHHEILAFAKEIEKNSSYKIVNEKEDSRVALLARKNL